MTISKLTLSILVTLMSMQVMAASRPVTGGGNPPAIAADPEQDANDKSDCLRVGETIAERCGLHDDVKVTRACSDVVGALPHKDRNLGNFARLMELPKGPVSAAQVAEVLGFRRGSSVSVRSA